MIKILSVLLILGILWDYIDDKKEFESKQPLVLSYSTPLASYSDEDVEWLAKNIYFEARSEPMEGWFGVAFVTMNRVNSPKYPNTIKDVVTQGLSDSKGNMIRWKCQFSWYCDGQSDRPTDLISYYKILAFTERFLMYRNQLEDNTFGAMYYHADYVDPYWNKEFNVTARIGRHIFYKE